MMQLPAQPNDSEVKLVSACPLCRKQYKLDEAYIVDEQQGAYLLHTECKNCGSSIVATLVAGRHAVSSMGLVTDLTSEDVSKFMESETVTCDDVIDCHAWLWGLA
ncbi:hypothetical protein ACFL0Z_00740 [Patescibacteria group bacterium]